MGEAKIKKEAENWPREVELTIGERLWLFNLLPREGDITTIRILRELREELETTDEEDKTYGVTQLPNGGTMIEPKWWEPENAVETLKSFSLARKEWELVKSTLTKISVQGKLNIQCIELYEKFVEPKNRTEDPPQA